MVDKLNGVCYDDATAEEQRSHIDRIVHCVRIHAAPEEFFQERIIGVPI